MRHALSIAAVALCAGIGLVACGGSDEPDDPVADAARVQVEEICTTWGLTFADRGAFPVEDFDPENPDPADLPAVGEYFKAGLDTQPEAIASLEEIDATGEQRVQLDALIAAWKREYASARAQSDAAIAADVDAFVATLDEAQTANDAVGEAANDLGVLDCGLN
jgi:hypothetical protein